MSLVFTYSWSAPSATKIATLSTFEDVYQKASSSGATSSRINLQGSSDASRTLTSLGAVFCLGAACSRRYARNGSNLTAMKVRKRPLPVLKEKVVTATKRLPLWKLSDEMYLERQFAPDPELSWTEVRRSQAKMREQVLEQQKIDMKRIEREASGFRLPPTLPIGEIRSGMWLEGRVSATRDRGVLVDVGAYTEKGEFVDAYLHMGQIREDGLYVEQDKIMNQVYLGEYVRVRVRQCVPALGQLSVSMRTQEDLPELFLGKPRPYSIYDLEEGMRVTGIVRRVWDKLALVDIGADRLARLHVNQHKRQITRYGFLRLGQLHKWASTAYAKGAQLDLWIKTIQRENVNLTCNRPRQASKLIEAPKRGPEVEDGSESFAKERLTKAQKRDREKSEAEKAPWDPYVPHVDEWLEDASEPNDEMDSWVARTERELFEPESKGGFQEDDEDESFAEAEDFAEDDFGQDEFADDDFEDFSSTDAVFGSGSSSSSKELDGWVLDETSLDSQNENPTSRLTEAQVEDLFHSNRDVGAEDFESEPRSDVFDARFTAQLQSGGRSTGRKPFERSRR